MNPVTEYIKNIGKSITYAAVEHVKEKAPAAASFAESNQELYQEVFHAVRDYRNTIKRAKDLVQSSAIYKTGDMAFSNAMEDIKSGKLYNKGREDSSFGGFDDLEMDMSDGFGDDYDPGADVSTGDKMVVKTVADSSRRNAVTVANAVASSAEYIAGTNKSIANMNYIQATRTISTLQTGFSGLSSGIDALHKFNTEVVSTHAENSKKFFETTTGLLQEQNAILKEMVTMQRERYKVAVAEEKEKKANRFEDIFNANGIPDLKGYGRAIGGNFKNALNEQTGGMLSMLSEDNLKMFASNPLAFIPQFLVSSLMGPKLNTALEKFDKTLSGAFTTLTARMNRNANDENASPFEQFMGKVFGLKNTVKTSIDTSKYEKGAIDFNGITQKSIVEVIPAHLRRIEALLSGQSERFFDHNSGKWTNAKAINQQFKDIRKSNVNNAMSSVSNEMAQMMQTMVFKEKADKEAFLKDMQSMFDKMYDDFGYFNHNDKSDSAHGKYGVESQSNFKILRSMMENLSRGTHMNLPNAVMSQREMHNRQMEAEEKGGHSIYNTKFNGYDTDSHIKVGEDGTIKAKYGNLGDSNNLLKIKDPFKKNIFDYLRTIHQELFIIRKSGGGMGGGKGKGRSRNNNTNVDFIDFTEDDWKRFYESKLGPREKSAGKLEEERRAQLNDSHRSATQAAMQRAQAEGRRLNEVDRHMEDTDRVTGDIHVGAVARNVHSDARVMDANSTWLNTMMRDSARDARSRVAENPELKDGMSFLDQLIHAGSLGAKYDVISSGISKLTSKPADILTGVLTKADQNIYDFFYGRDTGVKDENGDKIKGFFNRMVFDMKATFGKVNTWLDDTLLKPFKDKFGGKTVIDAGKNFLKDKMGVDVDELYGKAKGFFVGKDGILQPTIDAVKDTFRDAYEEAKKDIKKSYKDANKFYQNTIMGEQTDEQKLASAKKTAGVESIDEFGAFSHLVYNNSSAKTSRQAHKSVKIKYDELKSAIAKEKNPDIKSKLEKELSVLERELKKTGKLRAIWDNNITKYEDRSKEINSIDNDIKSYDVDDSAMVSERQVKIDELNKIKAALNLPTNVNFKDIDLKSDEYAHLRNKGIRSKIGTARILETEVSKMKTGKESLIEKKEALEKEQANAWANIAGSSKEDALKNPNLILAQAHANRKVFRGNDEDKKTFDIAIKSLSTLLGIVSSDPGAKEVYKTTETLLSDYSKLTKGFDNNGDAVKSIQTRINLAEADGKNTNSLRKRLGDVAAARGAVIGRYTNIFSEHLGMLLIPQEKIAPVVQSIISSTPIEALSILENDSNKFKSAIIKADPSLAPFLQNYKFDGVISNYTSKAAPLPEHRTNVNRFLDEAANADIFYTDDIKVKNKDILTNANRSSYQFETESEESSRENKNGINRAGNEVKASAHLRGFAQGARNITKSGLTVVSQGEAIIPSDVNPFNPDLKNADRRKDEQNERRIKQRLGRTFDVNDIAENANGSTSFGTSDNKNFGSVFKDAKDGTLQFFSELFGMKNSEEMVSKTNAEVKKHLPKGIAGGLLGGTIGLLTGIGGPLLGAIAGSAVSVASNSETLQKSLFGEKVYDKEGNDTGNRAGGLFSAEFQSTMKKYLPDAKTYGITGTVLGMLTPLGPLGGLMMGSAISFAKNNEHVQESLFGKTGLINDDSKKLIKKAFPHVAAGALAMMIGGPVALGLLGNTVLGSAMGLATTTDEFKDFMLGKADANGNRKGGLAGSIRSVLIDPMANFGNTMQSTFFNFMKRDIFNPLKRSMAPLGKQLTLGMKDTIKGIGTGISKITNKLLSPAMNAALGSLKVLAKPVYNKVKNGLGKVSGALTTGAGKVLSFIPKGIESIADDAREHQIAKSNADYMTASERIEFMAKRGKEYGLKGYDEKLSDSKKKDLEKVADLMDEIKKGRKFVDSRHDEYSADLKSTIFDKASEYNLDRIDAARIFKYASDGDMNNAHQLIQGSSLGVAEKAKLAAMINEKSEKLRDSKYRKDNYTGDSGKIFETLEKEHGIKGINMDNIDKYRSVLQTEIQSRHESTPDGKEEEQASAMNASLDANTDRLLEYLKPQTDLLSQIRDALTGITPEQRAKLNAAKNEGDYISGSYSKINDDMADARNKKITDLHGGEISKENRYKLADNDRRYNKLTTLGNKGRKLKNLDTTLNYNDKAHERFNALSEAGYDVKDHDAIARMEKYQFNRVLSVTQCGIKITNLDAIKNADDEIIQGMIELYKAGYTDLSQANLMKAAEKKSRYLDDKYKGKAQEAMKNSTNVDTAAASEGIVRDDTISDNIRDYRSTWQKAKDYANKKAPAIGAMKNQLKAAFEGGEINSFAHGTDSVPKDGLAIVSKGERIEPKGNTSVQQSSTEYGIATYTKSTDGSMRMDNSKDNQAIESKIEDRDNTQKGILENLKILSGTATGKAKKVAGAAADTAKGGLLGALSGLMGLFKLPLTLMKSIGSLAMAPLEMLGLGGVARSAAGWAGGKLSSIGKTAMNWMGDKAGAMGGKLKDKFFATKAGKKVSAWGDKFNNSKVGKLVSKGRSFLGSSSTDTGVEEPAEEPTEMVDAINVNRTSTVEYLKLILEAIQNGGVGGSGNPLTDAAGTTTNRRTGTRVRRPVAGTTAANTGSSKWAKAGKIGAIVGGVAALGYGGSKLFGGSSEQIGDDYQGSDNPIPTKTTTDKVVGMGGDALIGAMGIKGLVDGMSPETLQKAQVYLAKAKECLSGLLGKLGNWIPSSKVYTKLQEFSAKLIEKISTPRAITKIVEKMGVKLAMGPAYAASLATGGAGAVFLGAAEALGWFLHGWSNANEILGLSSGATNGMKFAAGFTDAVLSMIPYIGIIIPADMVLDMVMDYIGPVFGFTRSDVDKLKNANDQVEKQTSSAVSDAQSSSSNSSGSGKSFIENAWSSTKKFGNDVWSATKNGANYAIEKGSEAIDTIKEKGASMVDWVSNNAKYVADKASGMWESTKSAVSDWWYNRKTAKGKYGRGSLAAGFNSQLDPRNAMDFNTAGDTTRQTMKDSGCGPVSATNMASALGVSIDPKAAANYALNKGYKEKDGGTEPGYFGDLLGNYGIGTEKVNSSTDIKANLSQGNPVLLMGKDGRGVSSRNPYGEYNHYVVGTGLDSNGNILVQDPESNTPDAVYKANDVLSKSSMAIAASRGGMGKRGRGKYGRGNNTLGHDINISTKNNGKFGKGKYGRGGAAISPEHMWALANWVSKKIGIKPEFVYGQWYHESAGFTSLLATSNFNFGGMTQEQPTGDPSDKQPDGGNYYMHFGSPEEWAEYYARYITKCDGVIETKTVPEFAQALKDNGYYGASIEEYIGGVSGGIASIPGKYDTALVDTTKFGKTTTGSSSKSTSSGAKTNGGFLGKLAELSSTLSSALDLGVSTATSAKGKYGRSKYGRGPDDGSGGFLDNAISQAKQMSSTMQQSLSPIASGIMSSASKMFGDDKIKMIFGDNNPFSGVFGSKKDTASSSNSSGSQGQTGGKFTSTSTNEGIRAASNWASQLVQSDAPQGYGENGCTAFAKDYLAHAGNPLANQMDLYVPTLRKQAMESGLWKAASQGGAEGDIALIDTNNNMSEADGPDHAVIADGQGGYFGNSSSTLKVKQGPMAGTWGADKIWGYVSTGAGDSNVITGNKTNSVDVVDEAGPTSRTGEGKFGRGKFGLGNKLPKEYKNVKFGKGQSIEDSVQGNIIDINRPSVEYQEALAVQEQQLQKQQKASAANQSSNAIDYTVKFDNIISLLGVIASALTGGQPQSNTTSNPQGQSNNGAQAILSKLSSLGGGSGNGFGDLLAMKDTQTIINAMNAIVAK